MRVSYTVSLILAYVTGSLKRSIGVLCGLLKGAPQAVSYGSCGTSFRMASRIVEKTYEVLANPSIRSCSPSVVSTFVRIVCVFNLERISKLLENSWAFSLGLDSATHQRTSCLDIRARVFCEALCEIVNAHVAALQRHERHTGRAEFNMMKKALGVLLN